MAVPPDATVNSSALPSSSAANKPPASSHRLPTVSASEAFRHLSDDDHPPSNAYTDIAALDDALGGGFESGKVTELWGPPGAGKTAVAYAVQQPILHTFSLTDATVVSKLPQLFLEKNRLLSGSVCGRDLVKSTHPADCPDTSHSVSTHRVHSVLPKDHLSSFHHSIKHTLPHLLALLLHPPSAFPPPGTRLLILTNLHTLLETSNPRNTTFSPAIKPDIQKWAANRRYALLGSIISALNRLAVSHGLAVLVTTGCATRMRSEFGAPGAPLGLVPGVGGSEWETGVWARAAVLRDFGGRFVGVSKSRGTAVAPGAAGLGTVVAFEIGEGGVATEDGRRQQDHAASEDARKAIALSPVRGRKRALEEIADSDDDEEADEYGGWAGLEEDALTGVDGVNGEATDADAPDHETTSNTKAPPTIVID